jgi:predicted nucleic acid-binding protein
MTVVVHASVALKWYVSEDGSEAALALLESDERLIAPDLVVAELCNGAWRLIRRGELHRDQLAIIARGVQDAFSMLHGSASLAARAGAIALDLDHPVYDCFYLALSEIEDAPLVSADQRLIARTAETTFARRTLSLRKFSAPR